jgi:hypothetical protein
MKRDIRDAFVRKSHKDGGNMGNSSKPNFDLEDADNIVDKKKDICPAKKYAFWRGYYNAGVNWKYVTRYMEKSVGKPWNDLFAEVCKLADSRQYKGTRLKECFESELISTSPCHISKETGNLVDFYGKIVVEKESWHRRKRFYVDSQGILQVFIPAACPPPSSFSYSKIKKADCFFKNKKVKTNQYLVYSGYNYYLVDTIDVSNLPLSELYNKVSSENDIMLSMKHPKGLPEYYKLNPGGLEQDLRAIYDGDLVLGYRKSPAQQSIIDSVSSQLTDET